MGVAYVQAANNPFCGRMSTSLKCHTCQWSSPPCYRSFFDLTVSIKGSNQSIDELVKAACTTSESVSEVHCAKCWLSQLKNLAKDLPDDVHRHFVQKVKELDELPGCDFEEASNCSLTKNTV